MGNFNISMHQMIINSDSQMELYGDDGGGVQLYPEYVDASPVHFLSPIDATHKLAMIGEIDWFKATAFNLHEPALRVRKNISYEGRALRLRYANVTITNTVVKRGTVVRLVTTFDSKIDTAFQNQPIEKRYTVSADFNTISDLLNDLNAQFIEDVDCPIIPQRIGSNELYTDNKRVHEKTMIYVSPDEDGTIPFVMIPVVATKRLIPRNVYETMVQIQWNANLDQDRNSEYYPAVGAKYTSYYFELIGSEGISGGHVLPSEKAKESNVQFVMYINESLVSLNLQMQQLAFDMNI